MKILKMTHIPGPNVFNHRPVMVMTIDLEQHNETESSQVPEFVARILNALPGLHEHRCSRGYRGGFVERLHEGTYLGHIIEHIALELSGPTGMEAFYGKTVYGGATGVYKVVIECEEPTLSEHLLRTAFAFVDAALSNKDYDLKAPIEEGRDIVRSKALGPSTRAIVDAATRRGIPWQRMNDQSLVQLGYGKNRKFIQATQSWNTRAISLDISCDKALTKDFLERACIPVPYGKVVRTEEEARAAWRAIGGEAAIKPLDGNQGKGVSLHIASEDEAATAFLIAQEYSSRVIVEEMYSGDDYRLIVVGGKFVAAAKRMAPSVTGDGISTVGELLERENSDPRRGEGHEKAMTKIPYDAIAEHVLEKQGYTLQSIPHEGEIVVLRDNSNLSTGGKAIDVTDDVHPTIARMAERAADAIGLDVCGIDLMVGDISQPLKKGNGIVELNTAPGIRMHHFPSEGKARDVGGAIVDMLFPNPEESRIPIFSITGTNGKTTTTRLISHVMRRTGKSVGTTTTGGIWINELCLSEGDTTGPRSARTILGDPSVEIAVLETARGGLMRNGLGYDWSDVGIITNIQADHIGQDGIEDEDDILKVKSLVAERVRDGGTIVLNAADKRLAELPKDSRLQRQKLRRNIVFFALDPQNKTIQDHLSHGGTAYFVRDGWICEAQGKFRTTQIARVADIPMTLGGMATFQVENILATVAAVRTRGVDVSTIAEGLRTFDSGSQNPGRMNIFQVREGAVLIDYGHNPGAFHALSDALRFWKGKRTCVLGLPGDRSNEMIEKAAEAAAEGFDRIIIKEDHDLRGRAAGETADICLKAILKAFPYKDCRVVLDEAQALREAIASMTPGEVIAHFYDDLQPVMDCLKNVKAVPKAWDEVYSGGRNDGFSKRVGL